MCALEANSSENRSDSWGRLLLYFFMFPLCAFPLPSYLKLQAWLASLFHFYLPGLIFFLAILAIRMLWSLLIYMSSTLRSVCSSRTRVSIFVVILKWLYPWHLEQSLIHCGGNNKYLLGEWLASGHACHDSDILGWDGGYILSLFISIRCPPLFPGIRYTAMNDLASREKVANWWVLSRSSFRIRSQSQCS